MGMMSAYKLGFVVLWFVILKHWEFLLAFVVHIFFLRLFGSEQWTFFIVQVRKSILDSSVWVCACYLLLLFLVPQG